MLRGFRELSELSTDFRRKGPRAVPCARARPALRQGAADRDQYHLASQAADTSLRQVVSLSSWLQSGHRKMRISVSPPSPGTIAIKFISAAQRQSGSSIEP